MAIGFNPASMAGCASGACGPQQCKTAECATACVQSGAKSKGAGGTQQPDIQEILKLLVQALSGQDKSQQQA